VNTALVHDADRQQLLTGHFPLGRAIALGNARLRGWDAAELTAGIAIVTAASGISAIAAIGAR